MIEGFSFRFIVNYLRRGNFFWRLLYPYLLFHFNLIGFLLSNWLVRWLITNHDTFFYGKGTLLRIMPLWFFREIIIQRKLQIRIFILNRNSFLANWFLLSWFGSKTLLIITVIWNSQAETVILIFFTGFFRNQQRTLPFINSKRVFRLFFS